MTINAGTGNDYISNDGDNLLIQYSAGNDFIEGFNETSTLQIGDGKASFAAAKSGSDIVVFVGSNKITLDGAASLDDLNIDGAQKPLPDTKGTAKANSIVNIFDGAKILGLGGNDTITNTADEVTVDGGAGNDTIYNSGNNVLILYNAGEGNDVIEGFNESSTLQIGDGSDTYYSRAQGDDVIVSVGENSITLTGAANLDTVNIAGTFVNPYDIVGTDDPDSIDNNLSGATIQALGADDTIINSGDNVSILGGKGQDSIVNTGANTTIIGGTGHDTMSGGTGANVFVYNSGDGNDVITDFGSNDTLKIASGTEVTSASGSDFIFTVGKGKITLKDATNKKVIYIDKDGNVKTPDTPPVIIEGKTARLTEYFTDDSYTLPDSLDNINASVIKYDIELVGNKKVNSLTGGISNDILSGGAGNDTLTGGQGADLFVYSAGNDVITDYSDDEGDRIQINGTVSKIAESGNDIVFTVGSKSKTITVKDALDKLITYVDSSSEEEKTYPEVDRVIINDDGTAATLTNYYADDTFNVAKYGSQIQTIDASAVQHSVAITANTLANNITGTEDDDLIDAGAGRDSVDGGDGNDTIIAGRRRPFRLQRGQRRYHRLQPCAGRQNLH